MMMDVNEGWGGDRETFGEWEQIKEVISGIIVLHENALMQSDVYSMY